MVITCRTFLVQSGEVTFWGQKKFTQFITGLTGLPPDEGSGKSEIGEWQPARAAPWNQEFRAYADSERVRE
jgi:hypothetical protein